ncbi:hypothetical protein GCM10010389_22260 [Streptomyces echinoruber]|uniref:Uncharacterized protein n=1 Tax=Streptomyces echinoruber TaxID=68898 RepID=A0A918R3K4_9ACTN|nr:hypothetical protein GCM10010389_22260 [Streptomyces echinoruber]
MVEGDARAGAVSRGRERWPPALLGQGGALPGGQRVPGEAAVGAGQPWLLAGEDDGEHAPGPPQLLQLRQGARRRLLQAGGLRQAHAERGQGALAPAGVVLVGDVAEGAHDHPAPGAGVPDVAEGGADPQPVAVAVDDGNGAAPPRGRQAGEGVAAQSTAARSRPVSPPAANTSAAPPARRAPSRRTARPGRPPAPEERRLPPGAEPPTLPGAEGDFNTHRWCVGSRAGTV